MYGNSDTRYPYARRSTCLTANFASHLQNRPNENHSTNQILALEHIDQTREMLKELGRWKVHTANPVFREPASWLVRHLRFYDSEYQITQPE